MRFILYTPKGVRTGGPEAIHQLNYALKELGFDSLLLATWGTGRKKAIPEYEIYGPVFVKWWSLRRGDVFIVPEYFSKVPYHITWRISSIVFWWLSVDNCPFVRPEHRSSLDNLVWPDSLESKNTRRKSFYRRLLNIPRFIGFESKIMVLGFTQKLQELLSSNIELNEVIHIFQSNYAKEYVGNELKLEGLMVSDYTREKSQSIILDSKWIELHEKSKEFAVAYNPNKGLANVLNVEKFLDPAVKLIPIRGLNYAQLVNLFDEVDLYLDLGSLPGKDRLPREAILADCPVVITNLGAGHNSIDFPVPSNYKLQIEVLNPAEVAQCILDILKLGKLENLKMQMHFRETVSNEKQVFYREVNEFAKKIVKS